jgi:hypothetical protein
MFPPHKKLSITRSIIAVTEIGAWEFSGLFNCSAYSRKGKILDRSFLSLTNDTANVLFKGTAFEPS